MCELTLAEQPVKLAIDYDMPDQPTDTVDFSIIDTVVSLVKEHAVTNGIVDANWTPEYVVANGSRWKGPGKFKVSFHIVFQNLSGSCRSFLLEFMDPLCQQNPGIDRAIYQSEKSQLFRFIDSHKWGDASKTPLTPVTKSPLDHFIISNPEPVSIVLKTPYQKKRGRKRKVNSGQSNEPSQPSHIQQEVGDNPIMNELIRQFPAHAITLEGDGNTRFGASTIVT